MKKEKQVKSYQRRTKSGKVVTVKAHTATYDAAEKAAEMAKKKGAGEELAAKKKAQNVGDEFAATKDVSAKDFKEWYLFNDWDTPKNSWPQSVRIADSQIRKNLGSKKKYDEYCAKIDSDWRETGYIAHHQLYRVRPRPQLPPRVTSDSTATEEKKVPKSEKDTAEKTPRKSKKLERPVGSGTNGPTPKRKSEAVGKPTTKKFDAEKAMDEIFDSKDMYSAAKKYLGKAAVDRIYKSVALSRPSSSKEHRDRLLSQIEENIGELAWQNSQKK